MIFSGHLALSSSVRRERQGQPSWNLVPKFPSAVELFSKSRVVNTDLLALGFLACLTCPVCVSFPLLYNKLSQI